MDTITFGKPDFLSDPPNGWYDGESIYIGFEVSGENPYSYVWGSEYQLGTWDASGTESGYIRTVVTYYNAGDSGEYFDLSWGFLNPYTYNEGLDQLVIRMLDGEGFSDLLFEPDELSVE